MSGNGKVHRLAESYNVSHRQAREIAEELAHAAYLVATKERLEASVELAKAFEGRIADLESRLAAVEESNSQQPNV